MMKENIPFIFDGLVKTKNGIFKILSKYKKANFHNVE